MKNIVIIDVDSDREQQIKIGKSDIAQKPETIEEIKKELNNDLICMLEAFNYLLQVGHDNKFLNKNDLIDQAIIFLNKNKDLI